MNYFNKTKLRQVALVIIMADFPLVYVGAVIIESGTLTAAGLVIMTAAAALAALVY